MNGPSPIQMPKRGRTARVASPKAIAVIGIKPPHGNSLAARPTQRPHPAFTGRDIHGRMLATTAPGVPPPAMPGATGPIMPMPPVAKANVVRPQPPMGVPTMPGPLPPPVVGPGGTPTR